MTRNRRATLAPTLVVVAGVLTGAMTAAVTLAACDGAPSSDLDPSTSPSASGNAATSTPAGTSTTPSATAGTATPTATGTAAIQQQILDAYLGMQNAFQDAASTPDPDHPELPRHAAGAALELLTSGLTTMKRDGLRGTGVSTFDPAVTQLSPPKNPRRASVRDCMDTSATHLVKIDGSSYDDPPGGLRLVIATVERVDGVWKVTGLGIHEVGSCAG